MTLLAEFKAFAKHILYWIYALIASSFFFFIFGLSPVTILGRIYYMPVPSDISFAISAFNKIRYDLLPPDVQLVVMNPMSAFLSQIIVSLFLAFLLTMPFFIHRIILYIQPALLPREEKAVLWSLLPFVFLFFAGAAFSYFLLIPATFRILYPYASLIGATSLFVVDDFLYYVFGLMTAVGLMFLLPLFMMLLSAIHIVKPEFWKAKWRHAILFFLILSAIITPDGTGVTMMILFLPLALLYSAGYIFAKRLGAPAVSD